MRRAIRQLFPGAVVAVLAAASLLAGDRVDIGALTGTYGIVVYGAGLVLSWVFHRSRVFIVLAGLALVDHTLTAEGAGSAGALANGTVLLAVTGAMGVVRDRGLLSRWGLVQVALSAAFVVAARTALDDGARLEAFLAPLDIPFTVPFWPDLPMSTLAATAVALGGVAFGFWRWRGPVDRGLAWAAALMVAALLPFLTLEQSTLLNVAAGLTLTLSLVETSYVLAYRDDLTGLPARRALMQTLDGIGGTYTIAMVDVDHFKKFNDKHGHDVGDQVLRMVASHLAKAPGGARAFRYGGEEFTLLFPGRVSEEARPHLEELRQTIEDARFVLRSWRRPRKKPAAERSKAKGGARSKGGAKSKTSKGDAKKKPKRTRTSRTLSVTVSIGAADSAADGDGPDAVLARADQALYEAKKNGRNGVST